MFAFLHIIANIEMQFNIMKVIYKILYEKK